MSPSTTSAIRVRTMRANKLRKALGMKSIDVLRGVRATLGEPTEEVSQADYQTASRWFSLSSGRGPSDAALVWLELKAQMAGLPIARRD